MEQTDTPARELQIPEGINPLIPRILELTIEGKPRYEIAQILKVQGNTIWQLRQTPEYQALYQQAVADTVEEVRDNFKIRSRMAADKVFVLSQSAESQKVQLEASKDILDRGGFKPKSELEVSNVVKLDRAVLELFAETARELGAGSAPFILERVMQAERVLSDEVSPWTEQARRALAQGAG